MTMPFFVYTYSKYEMLTFIGRPVYRDAHNLHGQLVMYVLKYFICQCLLYIRVAERDTMNFYITMIIPVQLHKITY